MTGARTQASSKLLCAPLREAEFLAVDCETNGRAGEACEVTEIAGVLVGGGECHAHFCSLVAVRTPLSRGVQRLTGITHEMLADAPRPAVVLDELTRWLEGRVLVAHNASFDRRALRQAYLRADRPWPDPPVLCTIALARRLLPLQQRRGLGALAQALDIEMPDRHRALPDARACAQVLCALLPRLCAHAATLQQALDMLVPARRARHRPARRRPASANAVYDSGAPLSGAGNGHVPGGPVDPHAPQFDELPRDPGVYIFRDVAGRALYVGKSISIRSRARAHFAPAAPRAPWRAHAHVVDYRATASELGALVLENRLIKALAPPGNVRLNGVPDGLVYLRCRLDVPFPILEVARDPAPGHAVNVGPLHGRRAALELVEQLNSLFGLRHCGRRLTLREHPSAYGQMGRCLSPCLGDLDPNLYRQRLDGALGLFGRGGDGGARLLDHVHGQMRAASSALCYERATALRRRLQRLEVLLARLGGTLAAIGVRSELLLARHPCLARFDVFWLAGGRVLDWGAMPADPRELARRTAAACARSPTQTGAHVPAEELDEVRIVGAWTAAHACPSLALDPPPTPAAVASLAAAAVSPGTLEAQAAPALQR